jgi:hypothetical protein
MYVYVRERLFVCMLADVRVHDRDQFSVLLQHDRVKTVFVILKVPFHTISQNFAQKCDH